MEDFVCLSWILRVEEAVALKKEGKLHCFLVEKE